MCHEIKKGFYYQMFVFPTFRLAWTQNKIGCVAKTEWKVFWISTDNCNNEGNLFTKCYKSKHHCRLPCCSKIRQNTNNLYP